MCVTGGTVSCLELRYAPLSASHARDPGLHARGRASGKRGVLAPLACLDPGTQALHHSPERGKRLSELQRGCLFTNTGGLPPLPALLLDPAGRAVSTLNLPEKQQLTCVN